MQFSERIVTGRTAKYRYAVARETKYRIPQGSGHQECGGALALTRKKALRFHVLFHDHDALLFSHTKLSHVGLCGLTGLVAAAQRYSFTFFTRASRCFTFTRITLPKLDAWTPVVIEVFERVCDVLPRLAPPPVSW